MTDELLNTRQAAEILGVKIATLEKWRRIGRGPAFVRIGSLVEYRQAAIEQYLDAQTVTPQRATA